MVTARVANSCWWNSGRFFWVFGDSGSLQISSLRTSLQKEIYFLIFALFLDLTKINLQITSDFIQVKVSYPILFRIPIVWYLNISICYDYNYNIKFGAFREIIISRATSGGRREMGVEFQESPAHSGRVGDPRQEPLPHLLAINIFSSIECDR